MEKEPQPDSMATVTIKPDYPPSEVYSTSEPPPAYAHRISNSVQIARIVAITIVLSSFILGTFILASSWVTARAGCQQLDQLDAMLDKELALEGRRFESGGELLPLPEELSAKSIHQVHQEPPNLETSSSAPVKKEAPIDQVKDDTKVDEDRLQKIDGDENNDDSNSDSDEDELDLIRPFKLPVEFDLDDLAGAFLANNDMKGRMNCVVERRNSEQIEKQFPFNLISALTGGRVMPQHPVNSEKVSIICHAGDEQRSIIPEPASQVFAFPINGPPQMPINHRPPLPESLQPPALPQNRPFRMPMPWDLRDDPMMVPPREVRVHVQRVIAIPPPGLLQQQKPEPDNYLPQPQHAQQDLPQTPMIHHIIQQDGQDNSQSEEMPIPIPVSLSNMGLSSDDFRMIHRTAQDAIAQNEQQQIDSEMQEVTTIMRSLASAMREHDIEEENSDMDSSEKEAQPTQKLPEQQQQYPLNAEHRAMPDIVVPSVVQRPREGRSEDVPDMPVAVQDEHRAHYVQPRSIRTARSVENPLQPEKRVKRCSCACD